MKQFFLSEASTLIPIQSLVSSFSLQAAKSLTTPAAVGFWQAFRYNLGYLQH
jgi:hypothetical protein